MSDLVAGVLVAAMLLACLLAPVVERMLPQTADPGVYMPGPDDGVLPFQ